MKIACSVYALNHQENKQTVFRQKNMANPPIQELEEYYKVVYFYTFLDHAIQHLKTRFSKELEGDTY